MRDDTIREPADLARIIEDLDPTSYVQTLIPDRPYDGQPQTTVGERGETRVAGLTFRDVRDCFVAGCYLASGLPPEQYPRSVYDLPWEEMDIMAVWQNMACEIERRMGIYPNVPALRCAHCGEELDACRCHGEVA